MPPQSRNVVKCIYLKGMRYKETAEELNISVATVKTLLVNSLKRMRENTSEIDLEVLLLFIQKSLDRCDRFDLFLPVFSGVLSMIKNKQFVCSD